MTTSARPGSLAIARKGRLRACAWLAARRVSQLAILAMFLAGPWLGAWIVKGNLSYSSWGLFDLADPYVVLQSLVARHVPATAAIVGASIVAAFYALVGGRVYCAWVCPMNIVTDAAAWARRRLGVRGSATVSRSTRYWLLAATLGLSAVTGTLAWELVNPVSVFHRGLVFGMGAAWFWVIAVFLFDLLVRRRGWCGHVCPAGAFYGLVGRFSVLRVGAPRRRDCDDCGDCLAVCPEPQVIAPALRGAPGSSHVIRSAACTHCGRCIDVCPRRVFAFGSRFAREASETRVSRFDSEGWR